MNKTQPYPLNSQSTVGDKLSNRQNTQVSLKPCFSGSSEWRMILSAWLWVGMLGKVCRTGDVVAGSSRVTWSFLVREVAEKHFGLGGGTESSLTTLKAKGRAYRSNTRDPSRRFSYYGHLRLPAHLGAMEHLEHLSYNA